ncbi:MAG TPA: valine--tRNA ligase, partial [Chitinophagales bacterium]|nr:valine--tRNA ligase [Chitinophagales bacterium]
ATVRPETILGDSAIAVNPRDERYKNLVGQFAFVPLINRHIPIIEDEYVEVDFGTGALKVTPAHDMNDYQLGLKHNLEVIDILNEDGTMSEAAQLYVGQDRFECRKNIVKDLEAQGHIVKIEDYKNQIGFSERTDAIVEPRLSMQWWCNMKEMAKPALEAVMNEEIKFYPKKFVNLYQHWMENIRDWCISRQLSWGHRIPAWYAPDGSFAVAETAEEALQILNAMHDTRNTTQDSAETAHDSRLTTHDLKQDDDVLDTWFSSWLWPFEVFKGLSEPNNKEVKYYYPTNTLVTAPEIIFFWVARMIMAGFEYMKEKPFDQVYFTGIVRDKQGRKMSKQLGNSPDLLELIENYGADAVRFGILISSPAGNDLLFDDKLIEQGRNFNNKLWNALRLVKGWQVDSIGSLQFSIGNEFASEWFESKLNATIVEVERLFSDFQISPALKLLYSLVWDDFCSWYLEMIKPEFGRQIDEGTFKKTIDFFERLMKLLHPYMPFMTEEIYHLLYDRSEDDFITISKYPEAERIDQLILNEGEKAKELITAIRDLRSRNQIKPKEKLKLFASSELDEPTAEAVMKLGALSVIGKTSEEPENSFSFFVGADKFFLESPNRVDSTGEKSRLEKDLEYERGFLESVMKKLSNEKFVANAKGDVIEKERKKAEDAEEKIRLISIQLDKLNSN